MGIDFLEGTKMMKRTFFALTAVLGLLALVPLATAIEANPVQAGQGAQQQGQAQRARVAGAPQAVAPAAQQPLPAGPIVNRLAVIRSLNPTEEQWTRIREIRRRYAPQMKKLQEEVQDSRDALRQATYSESLDQKLIEQRIREFLEKQGQLIRLETQLEVEFRQVLTPEQLARFREIQDQELTIQRMRRELREREQKLQQQIKGPQRPIQPNG